jgi:hypothetical protein
MRAHAGMVIMRTAPVRVTVMGAAMVTAGMTGAVTATTCAAVHAIVIAVAITGRTGSKGRVRSGSMVA